jgi:hypothetical protein
MRPLRLIDYSSKFPARLCANCGAAFVAARSDAITCSVRCRMARHRKPEIDRIGTVAASALLDGQHYLGALEFNARYCLASPRRDALAVFATPTASAFDKALPGCLELTRLWQAQSRRDTGAPLSAFLRDAITWLRRDNRKIPCVFSYTDPAQCGPDGKPHSGGVYQWAGFSKLGQSRVTDLWRVRATGEILSSPVCYRRYRTKSRTALQRRGLDRIEKPGKVLYVFPLAQTLAAIRTALPRYRVGR